MASQMIDYARVQLARSAFAIREIAPLLIARNYRRFCIISPGRSGSQMLVQRCDSHPQVRCYGEVLAPGHITWLTSNRPTMDRWVLTVRDRDQVRFLERHVWHRYPAGIGAVGFKLLYSHLLRQRSPLEAMIRNNPDILVIWLDRRNRLEAYLSRLVARQTKVYFIHNARPVPQVPPVTIDIETCERSLKMLEVAHQTIGDILEGSNCLRLHYEDLVDAPDQSGARMCDFLGVEDQPLAHTARKLAQGSLRERIANYDQLQAHFHGTRWECYLAHD